MKIPFFRSISQHWRHASATRRRQPRRRFFRPLVENLESRDLLAINTTISTSDTANVSTVTAAGTTTFTATTSGANVNIADINSVLAAGKNVVIDSGSGVAGVQNGTISTSGITSFNFNNASGTTLTIQSGTGLLAAGADVNVTGLQMTKAGTLILDANQNVTLTGDFSAGMITITAGTGSITMPSGGELAATSLSLTAGGDIGDSANHLLTNVSQLTADTSANSGDQSITEANGLTALNLNAGASGNITLFVSAGAVSDTDPATDIAANSATVSLQDATPKDFGSFTNAIATSVNGLTVSTLSGGGNGNQFITESNGLTQLQLFAGLGSVTLVVTAGAVSDLDASLDIDGATATITLKDPTSKDFGSAADPIRTNVSNLTVDTSTGGGNQFITEDNGLTALNLNAGAGDVTLTVTAGAVADTDTATDITADAVTVELAAATAKGFGTFANPIATSVNSLTVETSSGGGNQFITESNGLTQLALFAFTGNVALTLTAGAVTDTDAVNDIFAKSATIVLSDPTPKNFGATSTSSHIQTSVDSLSVDTSAGGGNQFITEDDGLTALLLKTSLALNTAGNGICAITLTAGAITDIDPDVDLACLIAAVTLGDPTARDFGATANPISGSGSIVLVTTSAGGGNQFISQTAALLGIEFDAGTGNVTLAAAQAITDSDFSPDIIAAAASITLGAGSFGTLTHAIDTKVSSLSVNTSAASGDQFIRTLSTGPTTVTSLDAGTGSITLTTLSGGTFDLAAGNALGDLSALVVTSPAIVNLASSDETIGSLAGSGTVAFKANGQRNLLFAGQNNASTTFSGTLTGSDTLDGFFKEGSGTLTFSGNHTFAGQYTARGGKTLVNGTIAASSPVFTASQGGILGGTGTINRTVIATIGGQLEPGSSTGTINTAGLVMTGSLNAGLTVEITSAAAGAFDQVNVKGTVQLNDAAGPGSLNIKALGTVSLHNADELVIIKNDGDGATGDAVTGTFKDLPDGANLGSNFLGTGLTATLSYKGGDGNDVSIKLSPGSLFPWHNSANSNPNGNNNPLDVVGSGNSVQPDGHVVAGDALAIINYINAFGSGPVPASAVLGLPFGFLDTTDSNFSSSGDNFIAPGDALAIINAINAGQGGESESGADIPVSSAVGRGSPDSAPSFADLLSLLALDSAQQATRRRRA